MAERDGGHLFLAAEERAARLRTFATIRWIVAAAAFLYALALLLLDLTRFLVIDMPAPLFLSLLPLFFLAYNALTLALTRRGRLRSATAVGLGGDMIAVTLALYGTGGPWSWLWALYPLVTLEAAYLTERARPTVGTVLAGSLFYGLALAIASTGLGGARPPLDEPARPEAYLWIKLSWATLMNAAAAVAGLVAIVALRDARRSLETAYRQLDAQYAQLKELDRLKSNFLAVVSHELRTPMAILRGYTELVEEDLNLSTESREYLAKAEASAESLTEKINLMIAYAALASGQETLHPAPHRAGELLEGATRRVEQAMRESGLTLMIDAPNADLAIAADDGHLIEAMRQLLTNAMAATPRGGTVGASGRGAGAWVEFAIWDTGCGMPEAVRRRVGEPFLQASTKLSEHTPGLGLGLAYASLVATLHGGRLDLEDRPGGGTRVTLRVPASPESAGKRDRAPHLLHAAPIATPAPDCRSVRDGTDQRTMSWRRDGSPAGG